MNMTISFIIPAYNAGQYLNDCLDSIYCLDLKGNRREVLVVNDGSTDDTPTVLQHYQKKHPDLIVISQENKGLSMARNIAMDKASGDYLCFVDADDILVDDGIESLLHCMEKGIDIIGINIREVTTQGKEHPYRRYSYIYNKVYRKAEEFMRGRNLMPCAVAYLYRREFINTQQLRFLPAIYHEDEEFTPRVFAAGDSFMAADSNLYRRIVREDSITTTTDTLKQQTKLRDAVSILKRLDGMKIESMQYKLDYLAVDCLRTLMNQKHSAAFRKEIITRMKTIGYYPLHWHWNIKYICFNILTRFIFR